MGPEWFLFCLLLIVLFLFIVLVIVEFLVITLAVLSHPAAYSVASDLLSPPLHNIYLRKYLKDAYVFDLNFYS
jgi:hypothetical protein